MASYNRTRYVEDLLEKTESMSPSFTVHLHMEYWTLNNGSKFLYNNQIASLLDDVRAHRIPVDFLDLFEAAKVPFYDGCMVVELLDYRPQRPNQPTPDKPERTRVVLHPNGETLWADICSLNQKQGAQWTEMDAIDVEARILLTTSPPLCLEPDPHLTRIANHILRVSTPTVPVSLKRKASAMDAGEEESEKARRVKIMSFLNPRQTRTVAPSSRILDFVQTYRAKQAANASNPAPPQPPTANAYMAIPPAPVPRASASPQKPPTPSVTASHANSPIEPDDKKKTAPTPQMPYAMPGFVQRTGSQTPAPTPVPSNHQFVNAHTHPQTNPSPAPVAHSPLQPVVYPSVQAATEAAKRAATPAQRPPYVPSPRPSTATPMQQQQQQPPPPPNPQPQPMPPAATAMANHYLAAAVRAGQTPAVKPPQPISATNSGQGTAAQPGQQVVTQAGQPALIRQQLMYMQQHGLLTPQQQQLMQQKVAAAGRATPQLSNPQSLAAVNAQSKVTNPVGSAAQASPTPVRASPMINNQSMAARSPMPVTNQLPGQQQPQQPTGQQQGQHIQQPQQQQQQTMAAPQMAFQYNPALLRPVVQGNIPPQLANMAALGQQAQQQAQQAQQAAAALAAAATQSGGNADGNQQQNQVQQQLALLYNQQMMYAGYGAAAVPNGGNASIQQQYQQQMQAAQRYWVQAQHAAQAQGMGRGTPIPGMAQPMMNGAGAVQGNMAGKVPNQGRQ